MWRKKKLPYFAQNVEFWKNDKITTKLRLLTVTHVILYKCSSQKFLTVFKEKLLIKSFIELFLFVYSFPKKLYFHESMTVHLLTAPYKRQNKIPKKVQKNKKQNCLNLIC